MSSEIDMATMFMVLVGVWVVFAAVLFAFALARGLRNCEDCEGVGSVALQKSEPDDEQRFRQALVRHRDALLEQMKGVTGPNGRGFWRLDPNTKQAFHTHDAPTPYDVNSGWCEDFMKNVRHEFTDAEEWVDDDVSHYWLKRNGKHYDAECIEGVLDHRQLPIFQRHAQQPVAGWPKASQPPCPHCANRRPA